MREFMALIRINFLSFLGALQKKKKGRYVGGVVMILFFVFIFGGSMSMQAVMSAYQLVVIYNLPRYAIFVGIVSSLAFSLLFGLMRATNSPTSKDADLLLAMPIRKSTVVLSKIITQYLFDAPILILLLLPTMIATFVFGGLQVDGLLRGVLAVLIIPVLSLTVSLLFGYLFSFIRERVPGGSIILTGITMVILLGYIVINMQTNTAFMRVAEMGPMQTTQTIGQFFPLRFLTYFITDGGLTDTVGTMAFIFAPFAVTLSLFASRYGRSEYQRRSKNRNLNFRVRPLRSTLLRIELKKYLASSLYVFNTAFGTIMMIAGTVAILVMGPDKVRSILEMDGDLPLQMSMSQIAAIIAVVFSFMGAMTITTPSSISFEGKKFWIVRSLPIRVADILAAKLMLNILLFVPFVLICSFLVSVRFGLHPIEGLAFAILPAMVNITIAVAGLIINLLMPKLDWRNEAEIIKQSMSVMLAVLLGFAISATPIVMYFLLFARFGDSGLALAGFASSGFLMLILVIELLILFIPGKKIFENIPA